MQKPESAIEKEFNDNGIFFLAQASIKDPFYQGKYIGVDIEIGVISQTPVSPPDFAVSVVNRRGVAILFTDWEYFERDGQNILKLSAYQRVPDDMPLETKEYPRYMSFLDLCFYAGNEAIPEVYGEDVITKPRQGALAFDLGWIMPTRFIDAFIEAFGKLDNTMLGGNINQALLYGPVARLDIKA